MIEEIAGPVEIFASKRPLAETPAEALPSPGVGLRHYAPRARLVLVEGPLDELGARMAAALRQCGGARAGVMLPAEVAWQAGDEAVFACKRCQRLGRNYMTWIKREDWNGLGYAYFNELTQHAQAYAAPFCARCRADYSRISYRRKHVAPYEPAF